MKDKTLNGWVELPERIGRVMFASLSKGAGHKYIKRIPTGNPKRPYRYIYKETHAGGVYAEEHMSEGAKFKYGDGHYHVEKDHGDGTVTVIHDETGESRRVKKSLLSAKLKAHHGKAIREQVKKLRQLYEESQTEQTRSRWKKQLEKLGETVGKVKRKKRKESSGVGKKSKASGIVNQAAQISVDGIIDSSGRSALLDPSVVDAALESAGDSLRDLGGTDADVARLADAFYAVVDAESPGKRQAGKAKHPDAKGVIDRLYKIKENNGGVVLRSQLSDDDAKVVDAVAMFTGWSPASIRAGRVLPSARESIAILDSLSIDEYVALDLLDLNSTGFTESDWARERRRDVEWIAGKHLFTEISDQKTKESKEVLEGMSRAPMAPSDIYRGVRLSGDALGDIRVGSVLDMGSITSWTQDLGTAKEFAYAPSGNNLDIPEDKSQVVFKVLGATRGTDITDLSTFSEENEVVSGGRYRVDRVSRDGSGVTYINLKEMDD